MHLLDWNHTVSLTFLNAKIPSASTEELVLCHSCCVLSRLHCNRHSFLLNPNFSSIGRIENYSCSICSFPTFHLLLFCQQQTLSSAHCLATTFLYTVSGPGHIRPASGPHFRRRDQVTTPTHLLPKAKIHRSPFRKLVVIYKLAYSVFSISNVN